MLVLLILGPDQYERKLSLVTPKQNKAAIDTLIRKRFMYTKDGDVITVTDAILELNGARWIALFNPNGQRVMVEIIEI